MEVDDRLALALLEVIALLFPFVALMYDAFIPDSVGYINETDSWADALHDPRRLCRYIVVLLVASAVFALSHFWGMSSIGPYLKAAIFLLILVLAFLMFLTDTLITYNRHVHREYDDWE